MKNKIDIEDKKIVTDSNGNVAVLIEGDSCNDCDLSIHKGNICLDANKHNCSTSYNMCFKILFKIKS